jgi:hypothetical protein
MAERTGIQQRRVLIDPKTPLPCALGVVASTRASVNEIGALEREARERQFVVRAACPTTCRSRAQWSRASLGLRTSSCR